MCAGNSINNIDNQTTGPNSRTTITYYSQDASGNQFAIYKTTSNNLSWESGPIYGGSRVGVYEAQKMLYISGILQPSTLSPGFNIAQRGMRQYEVSNNLGNSLSRHLSWILTTISDRRSMVTTSTGVIINYDVEIITASDYYPLWDSEPWDYIACLYATFGGMAFYTKITKYG